jgi:hypothetical protein
MNQVNLVGHLIKQEKKMKTAAEQYEEHQPEFYVSEAVAPPPSPKDGEAKEDRI